MSKAYFLNELPITHVCVHRRYASKVGAYSLKIREALHKAPVRGSGINTTINEMAQLILKLTRGLLNNSECLNVYFGESAFSVFDV
jgi:hypothetical protein